VYNCPCESKTKSFKNIVKHGFNKYCYINKLSCTNKSIHNKDRDGYWGAIKKNKERYKLLATKKNKKIKYRWKKCGQPSSMRMSN
jgi:hypothetical protein